jgi:hypothetical protein
VTYWAAALIVALAILVATAASWLCGRGLAMSTRQRHHEVGEPVFQQVGTLIAVLLAFVFSSVWSDYRTAAQAINGECSALHGAVMMAGTLPASDGESVIGAIRNYTRDVVGLEWASMAARHRSVRASADLQQAIGSAARIDGARADDAATKAQILSLLSTAHANRETRLFQMTQAVPAVLWFVLIAISVVLVLFIASSGVDEPGRTLFAAIFTGAITMVLVLVRMLDFPFEGALALPPTDFIKLLDQSTEVLQGLTTTG